MSLSLSKTANSGRQTHAERDSFLQFLGHKCQPCVHKSVLCLALPQRDRILAMCCEGGGGGGFAHTVLAYPSMVEL